MRNETHGMGRLTIQMATAIKAGAAIFLTNEIRLPSLPELKVLALDTLKAQTESA